ncbi:MAG: hypothetical protein K2I76_03085, partial [Malacoplasma sp.]|nr:hypothetical protein [Malacoplasma sp.]
NYLESELKKEQEKFSIIKFKEVEELIDIQNNEISTLLNDWERLIFELERYLENVLNISGEKYDEYSSTKITDLNSSLGLVINNFKSKVDNLENNFKNKISNINENIDSIKNEEILKIQKNLFDNYSFLKNDLENIFKNILFKIDEIKSSENNEILKSKVNDLVSDVQNIKSANEISVKKLNDKNLLLEKIENFVTEKFEKNKVNNKKIENFYANSDDELSEKLTKLENWYSNLVNHIENNNKDVINAYVDNKINEIRIENNINENDLFSTYKAVISKLSQISNLLNLSKDNISNIFNDLFRNYRNELKISNLLAEFNKVVIANNKMIANLSYQNDKYLESIHLAKKKNTLFEIGKELVGVLDLLTKSQSLLSSEFANFEIEQKALNQILLNPFNADVIENAYPRCLVSYG